MVVGNGFIASAFSRFKDSDDVVIFASGVSNSRETIPDAFLREETLLRPFLSQERLLVYFSTTSVFDKSLQGSKYVEHKLKMEELVRSSVGGHIIFRLPIMVGYSPNPNTLINFLIDKVVNCKPFVAHSKACRYLMSISDIEQFVPAFIHKANFRNKTHNIYTSGQVNVLDIIKELEIFSGKTAQFSTVDDGDCYEVELSEDILSESSFKLRPLKELLSESFVERNSVSETK